MHHFAKVLSLLLTTASIAVAQNGFSTKTYSIAGQSTGVQAYDFNHDGYPDLFLTGASGPSLLLNNGSGGFGTPVALTSAPYATYVADLNGDGYPDLVGCAAPNGSQSYLYTYLNDGTGKFSQTQQLAITGSCSSVNIGDVNLDGHPDIVVISFANTGSTTTSYNNVIATFLNDGTGHLGTPTTMQNVDLDSSTQPGSSYSNCYSNSAQGGNFYNDNNYSLVLSTECFPANSDPRTANGAVLIAHGNGTGQFTFTTLQAGNDYETIVSAADINKDGIPDILMTSTDVLGNLGNLTEGINDGSGYFNFTTLNSDFGANLSPVGFITPIVADLNGDGYNDIITVVQSGTSTSDFTPYISILNGSANGTFAESQNFQFGLSTIPAPTITVGDFNKDGKLDFAAIDYNANTSASTLNVYMNTGGGTGTDCVKPSTYDVAIICTPAAGSTVTSPVSVLATNSVVMVSSRLYLDNVSVYQTTSQTLNTQITASAGKHNLVYVVYDNSGNAYTASSVFTVGGAGGGCLPSGPGATICAPTSGSTTGSPVTITAGAIAQSGNITALRAYIDNNILFTTNNTGNTNSFQVSQSATIAPGTHNLVIVGYQSTGGAQTSSLTFTVSGNAACYPSTQGAKICSPASGATSASPVSVVAGATTNTGYIASIRVYVDNVAQTLVTNPQQSKSFAINQPVSLATGSHNLVIVAYPSTGGALTSSETITIN